MVLDEQPALVDLLERPPHALDVLGVHRPVGLVGVDPVAHALGHLLELVDVAEDRLAALGVELGDAVVLDVLLAGEAELLLDGELDGQAVTVPASLAGTRKPFIVRYRGKTSLKTRASMWCVPGVPLAVGGPS